MFKSMENGFQVTFSNNIVVSIQFNTGHYCDNGRSLSKVGVPTSCPNAEVAVFRRPMIWITKEVVKEALGKELSDNVMGYVTPDEVAKIIRVASEWKE